jgi:hypothetical protein
MTRRNVTIVAASLLVFALGAQALLVRRVDRLRADATLEEVLYIPSSKAIRRLSLGYTGLAADIYWTRVVQYFGEKHGKRSMRYDLLAPLLEITTDLDPNLLVAYEFGSIFLAQQPPEGAGRPDQAVQLVEKGIRQNPEAWRLYYTLGFIHYIEREDYLAASDAFLRGSRVPGAHPWLRLMAAMEHAGRGHPRQRPQAPARHQGGGGRHGAGRHDPGLPRALGTAAAVLVGTDIRGHAARHPGRPARPAVPPGGGRHGDRADQRRTAVSPPWRPKARTAAAETSIAGLK